MIVENMKTINAFLNQNNDTSMFVTAFMGIINVVTGTFNYVNAGHNTPLLLSKGEVKPIALNEGIALGVVDEIDNQPYTFIEREIQLVKDDLLLFYTDGITEAFNKEMEMYSETRLKNFLASIKPDISLPHVVQKLKAEIDEHTTGMEQSDDMTLLLARFTG